MNSDQVKNWIENHISNNIHLKNACVSQAMKWNAKLWKRASKRTIRNSDEFSWLAQCPEEFVGVTDLSLEGCIVRYFDNFGEHAEAQILVITDNNDSKVLTWAFNID